MPAWTHGDARKSPSHRIDQLGDAIPIDGRIAIPAPTRGPSHGEDIGGERSQPPDRRLIQGAGQSNESAGFLRLTDPSCNALAEFDASGLVPRVKQDAMTFADLGGLADNRHRIGRRSGLP